MTCVTLEVLKLKNVEEIRRAKLRENSVETLHLLRASSLSLVECGFVALREDSSSDIVRRIWGGFEEERRREEVVVKGIGQLQRHQFAAANLSSGVEVG